MKARERYLKTFRGEKTDRMPVSLFIVEQGHFMSQLHPDTPPYDHQRQFEELAAFNRQLGADTYLRLLGDIYEPALHFYGGVDIWQQTENWEVKTDIVKDGTSTKYNSTIRTPKGSLTQQFTVNEIRPGTFMYGCTAFPVKNEEDLDLIIEYEPQMPADYPEKVKKATRFALDLVGDDGIVGSWVPYGAFNNASMLLSHEEMYCLFLTEPEMYEKLMEFSVRRFQPYIQAVMDAGPDVIQMGGNVPGGFLGKENYEEYVLKYERQCIEFCQKQGAVGMYHNCGLIMSLVESYKKLGALSVEPFSPNPLGDADVAKALDIVDGAYTVTAGIDQVNVIQKGTKEQVVERTRQLAQLGREKGRGRFIIQNADFLEYGTPVENVEAFVKTALENAAY